MTPLSAVALKSTCVPGHLLHSYICRNNYTDFFFNACTHPWITHHVLQVAPANFSSEKTFLRKMFCFNKRILQKQGKTLLIHIT